MVQQQQLRRVKDCKALAGEYVKTQHKPVSLWGPLEELNLLVVLQQQLRRVKDCKAVAGEYVKTQHKPVLFEIRMEKWKEKRTMGPNIIKWWKCKDDMMVEYRERVRMKYKELDADTGAVDDEWRQYKDAFVEELCGRTSGRGGTPRSRNQGWWTEEAVKAVGEKREAWKIIEGI